MKLNIYSYDFKIYQVQRRQNKAKAVETGYGKGPDRTRLYAWKIMDVFLSYAFFTIVQ